jgi:predicted RNA-binding Zn ribbon-like protein
MVKTRDAEKHHLVGGKLCLDFANTLYGHTESVHEYLFDYRDLVLWSSHTGILPPDRAMTFLDKWKQFPAESEEVFHQAIQLRETIYRIFASLVHTGVPDEDDLLSFQRIWLEHQTHSRLERTDSGFVIGWEGGNGLESMLWPITHSAVELLISEDLKQVKQCDRCDWLFVDRSRNHKRRWCSMSACGNRVKMARRYERTKQLG